MLVVDASVLVAAATGRGDDGTWAESVIGHRGLIAPQVAQVEATQAFRRLELAGVLGRHEATAAAQGAVELAVELLPFEPFASRVWELRHNLSAYDAWYVALAEAFELPLATLDRRLAAAPSPECEFLTP